MPLRDTDLELSVATADALAADYAAELEADGLRRRYACEAMHLESKQAALAAAGHELDAADLQGGLDAARLNLEAASLAAAAKRAAIAENVQKQIEASPYAGDALVGWRHDVARGTVVLLGSDDAAVTSGAVTRLHALVRELRAAHPEATRAELAEYVRAELVTRAAVAGWIEVA